MVQFKKLETTLEAGTNTHTFTDDLITDNSVIEIYTDNDDVYPVNIEQSGHSVNIEIVAHTTAVRVAITINNVITYEPTDISGLENEIQTVSDNLSGLSTVVNELSDNVDNIEGDVSTLGTMVTDLETSKQDTLTAGENITIVNNVISSTGGGGVAYTSGTATKNNNYVSSGTVYWFKLGRIVVVVGSDIQFNVVSKSWNNWSINEYIFSGLPKKSSKIFYLLMRNNDGTNVVRCAVNNTSEEGRLCPHYTSVSKNNNNYYFCYVYESGE